MKKIAIVFRCLNDEGDVYRFVCVTTEEKKSEAIDYAYDHSTEICDYEITDVLEF